MADRAVSIMRRALARNLAGVASASALLCLTIGTLVAVALRAEAPSALGAAEFAAIRFTLLQAVLSALISVGLAIPVARALARRRFRGRGLIITLLGAPFILPVIVAILGLLAVFGQAGFLNAGLAAIGLPTVRIYGLQGVVLAHVFFNLPLATRLILQGWLAIPSERFRLAASLGFSKRDIVRALEWPMLRSIAPGALMIIFLISMTSFAVALTLGGGPRATTIELAIYQAFRFDFDLSKAALLALVQFAICAAAAVAAFRVMAPSVSGTGLDRTTDRWDAAGPGLRLIDGAAITGAVAFLLVPLLMIALRGVVQLPALPSIVWWAAGRSVLVALGSTVLMLLLALPLAILVVRLRERRVAGWVEGIGYISIAASPLVVGTGLFIVIFPLADPRALALPVTALVNAAMALPFAMRALVPALRDIEVGYGRLADSLGLTGLQRLRILILPRLRRPLGFVAGLAAALSMGDLGVVALFADPDAGTLPLMLYRLMGAYRMDDAAGAALLLLLLSVGLFYLFDRGGRINADT